MKKVASQKEKSAALQVRFSEPAVIIPIANSQHPGKAAAVSGE
jgi:hypothetical protein